jgi:hypothetical protein
MLYQFGLIKWVVKSISTVFTILRPIILNRIGITVSLKRFVNESDYSKEVSLGKVKDRLFKHNL